MGLELESFIYLTLLHSSQGYSFVQGQVAGTHTKKEMSIQHIIL
jgi:hypothetical protein